MGAGGKWYNNIKTVNGMPKLEDIYLYHIVNFDRLKSIFTCGCLYSDLTLRAKGISGGTSIAYEHIRARRRCTPVLPHKGLYVGACAPFYFARHVPMLYRAKMGKTQGYDYEGGQDPIVYLVFKLTEVIDWAQHNGRRWVFTDRNAADGIVNFYSDLSMLPCLNWDVIRSKQWQGASDVKAAEFLVEEQVCIPDCLRGVATMTEPRAEMVRKLMKMTGIDKPIKVLPKWYF